MIWQVQINPFDVSHYSDKQVYFYEPLFGADTHPVFGRPF